MFLWRLRARGSASTFNMGKRKNWSKDTKSKAIWLESHGLFFKDASKILILLSLLQFVGLLFCMEWEQSLEISTAAGYDCGRRREPHFDRLNTDILDSTLELLPSPPLPHPHTHTHRTTPALVDSIATAMICKHTPHTLKWSSAGDLTFVVSFQMFWFA